MDIQKVVRAGRTESAGGRVRFSAAAREAAVGHVRRRRAQGLTLVTAARETGVPYQTLREWLGKSGGGAFRRVEVMAPEHRALTVVLGSGARVEGMSLEDVVELARRLR
jgi:hypothetical protein